MVELNHIAQYLNIGGLKQAFFNSHCFLSRLRLCSLKVQQGLLIDFASFPQKFIDLLNQCLSEQESDNQRYVEMQTTTLHHAALTKLFTDLYQS